jgi:putative ABC transport system ATP-binding protein
VPPDRSIAVSVRGLSKTFGSGETRVEALRGVDLDLEAGGFTAVMGPSGSGKSTLLHAIGGLTRPSAGSVTIEGRDLASLDDDELTLLRRRRIGFVFQAFNLLPVLSAEENVALPLRLDGVPPAEATRRALESLARVGVEHRRAHRPGEMSGGEQQRVAIARAVAIRPAVLLADEPTGNLDSVRGEEVMGLLRRLVGETGLTILMVTHDASAAAVADRLVVLRDGTVYEEHALEGGSADDVRRHVRRAGGRGAEGTRPA